MESLIREVHETVPFNNFRPFLVSRGVDVPERVGGNCVYQAGVLRNRLLEKGSACRVFRAHVSDHHIVLGGEEEEAVILDPIRFLRKAVKVEDVRREGRLVSDVFEFPGKNNQPMVFSLDDRESLSMCSEGAEFSDDASVFDLKEEGELPREDDFVAMGIGDPRLVLAYLEGEKVVRIIFDSRKGLFRVGDGEWRQERMEALSRRFCEISEHVEVDPKYLFHYFSIAAEIRGEIERENIAIY